MPPQLKTLRQTLVDRDAAFLEVIAQRWGLVLEGRRRAELIDQLEAAILEPETLQGTLADLSPSERDALDALVQAGGHLPVERFARQHGPISPVGPGRLRREGSWRQPAGGAEALWYHGLIALGFDLDAVETEVAYIPPDLLQLLPRPQRAQIPFDVPRVAPVGSPREGGPALLQDVCTLLIYLYNEVVRPGSGGELPQRHQRQLVGELLDVDPDRLALMEHLAQRLGLIDVHDRRLEVDRSHARAWLRSPPSDQLRALQEGWRYSAEWNDLFHVPSLECQSTGWSNDPVATRERLLAWLARCPPAEWLSIEGFVQTMKSADPDFQRPDGDYDGWYIRDVDSGEYLTGFASWDQVEGALIRDLLARPFCWLGIVDLSDTDEGSATAFRLTAQGQALLERTAPREPGSTPPMVVESGLTIRAPLRGSLYDRFQVARFAERVAAAGKEDAFPFAYRITPQSLARSREQEIPLDQLMAFLERASAGDLPSYLPILLADWERKADKVALQRAVLLRTSDEVTLEELQHLPQTRRYLQEVLGPQAALVAEEDWPQLLQELRELSYLPEVQGLANRRASRR